MDQAELLPSLNLMTLIGVVVVALIAFLLFMRKRSNRQATLKHPDDEVIATVRTTDSSPRPRR
jgi:LPXTG-motif cell wall-anchored protein